MYVIWLRKTKATKNETWFREITHLAIIHKLAEIISSKVSSTVWIFKNFSATLILREISFHNFRVSPKNDNMKVLYARIF